MSEAIRVAEDLLRDKTCHLALTAGDDPKTGGKVFLAMVTRQGADGIDIEGCGTSPSLALAILGAVKAYKTKKKIQSAGGN